VETELKFQVPAANRESLRQAVATASAKTTRLQAVYVDTADQRLAAAGLALRLRKEGGVWQQTLKGRGDGLAQRLEHEVSLGSQPAAPRFDTSLHSAHAAGTALSRALVGARPLLPVYRTDIQRVHRHVRTHGAVVELAYDRGFIQAGAKRLAVDEIEFELISGPAVALPLLAMRWVQSHGLWWDIRTKSEQGFRLAFNRPIVPAVKAQRLQNSLRSALVQVLRNAAELASDSGRGGPEHAHQLRLGMRRLKTALGTSSHTWDWAAPLTPGMLRAPAFNVLLLEVLHQLMQPAAAHPDSAHP
jgi:triphosphatase